CCASSRSWAGAPSIPGRKPSRIDAVKRETAEEKRRRAASIARRLAETYPGLRVPLDHKNTFELLVAVILSAQTTDEMVNRVTPELFRRYPTPQALARAPQKSIEMLIRRLGLFHAKAVALKKMSRELVDKHAGEVPQTMEELTALAGVGRK